MGWTCLLREKGLSDKEFFQGEFGSWPTILDTARVGSTVYMACRSKDGSEVFAVVALTRRNSHDPRMNFCYKDMDEGMEPFYYDCPKRILDLLSPTENKNSLEWRRKCREALAKKATRLSVRTGDIVETAAPVTFRSGYTYSKFVFTNARKLLCLPVHSFNQRTNVVRVADVTACKLRRYCLEGAKRLGHVEI